METTNLVLIEMAVFSGAALAFGIWQYVSVSRELEKTRSEAARRDADQKP